MTRQTRTDPLEQLIDAGDHAVLGELIRQLAAARSEVRRECLEFLKEHVAVNPQTESNAGARAAFSL